MTPTGIKEKPLEFRRLELGLDPAFSRLQMAPMTVCPSLSEPYYYHYLQILILQEQQDRANLKTCFKVLV